MGYFIRKLTSPFVWNLEVKSRSMVAKEPTFSNAYDCTTYILVQDKLLILIFLFILRYIHTYKCHFRLVPVSPRDCENRTALENAYNRLNYLHTAFY